jgi:hypothetical protein
MGLCFSFRVASIAGNNIKTNNSPNIILALAKMPKLATGATSENENDHIPAHSETEAQTHCLA